MSKSVLYFLHEKLWYRIGFGLKNTGQESLMTEQLHIVPHEHAISQDRAYQRPQGSRAVVTGLGGSGKHLGLCSRKELHRLGIEHSSWDNVRVGLNSDLGFGGARGENIRRIARQCLDEGRGTCCSQCVCKPIPERQVIREKCRWWTLLRSFCQHTSGGLRTSRRQGLYARPGR